MHVTVVLRRFQLVCITTAIRSAVLYWVSPTDCSREQINAEIDSHVI